MNQRVLHVYRRRVIIRAGRIIDPVHCDAERDADVMPDNSRNRIIDRIFYYTLSS